MGHVLDFSKVWIDHGGSVRHYTHDREAFKTFSLLFEGTKCVGQWRVLGHYMGGINLIHFNCSGGMQHCAAQRSVLCVRH